MTKTKEHPVTWEQLGRGLSWTLRWASIAFILGSAAAYWWPKPHGYVSCVAEKHYASYGYSFGTDDLYCRGFVEGNYKLIRL